MNYLLHEPLKDVGKPSPVWPCRVKLLPRLASRAQDQIMTLSASLVLVVTAIGERRGGSSSWLWGRMWVDAGLGSISSLCSKALTGWINMEADNIISCYYCCVSVLHLHGKTTWTFGAKGKVDFFPFLSGWCFLNLHQVVRKGQRFIFRWKKTKIRKTESALQVWGRLMGSRST